MSAGTAVSRRGERKSTVLSAVLLAMLSGGCIASWGGESLYDGGAQPPPTGGTGGTGPSLPSIPYSGPPWAVATGDLYEKAPGAGELNVLVTKPGTNRLVIGVAGSGMWSSDDGAKTWTHLGSGAGSAMIKNGPTVVIFDRDHPGTFWESGSYGPAMYKTVDDGLTFQTLGDLQHVDVASVDTSDPERKTILAGAHEQKQKLYLSRDSGATWMDIGPNLPADSSTSYAPLVLDAMTFLVADCTPLAWNPSCAVFRSSDGGMTFTKTSPDGPFGPALVTASGAIYWELSGNGMIVSTDRGMTWTKTSPGPLVLLSGAPLELPDGRVVAMGDTHLLITADQGKTWKQFGPPRPYPHESCMSYGPGFAFVQATKTFYLSHESCQGKLPQDALYSFVFDYTKQ